MFAICAGILVYGSGRGFDLTDETFYLIWARDPHAYQLMYQPFGYALHPLFRFVDGNLRLYRLTGFVAAAFAGAFLGGALSRSTADRGLFALYGAGAALTAFFPWIITPSYNSMADVGAMLTISGILYALETAAWARIAGAGGIGAGLCLSAFAKPPLFAVSTLVIVIAIVASRARLTRFALVIGLALAAGLISILVPPSQLSAIVERIVVSQHILSLPNTPLRLPIKIAADWLAVAPALIGAAIVGLFSLGLRPSRWSNACGYAAIALSFYYLASVAQDCVDQTIPDFLGLAAVTLAVGYAGTLRATGASVRWLVVALLLGAPAAVALGTFNNQWFQLNFSLPFALIALFTLASGDGSSWRRRAAQAFTVGAPIALILIAAWAPYSLPASIFDQQVQVEAPLAGGRILVDDETAAFLNEARGLAGGAILIDLSGTGPGVSVVLGGRAPVMPWLAPATPTWPDVVWSRLSAQQRRQAWFVVPVWPAFVHSAPARWLVVHKGHYCAQSLPEIPFWGEERSMQLWKPCERSH